MIENPMSHQRAFAAAAHDVRTPLQGLLASVETLMLTSANTAEVIMLEDIQRLLVRTGDVARNVALRCANFSADERATSLKRAVGRLDKVAREVDVALTRFLEIHAPVEHELETLARLRPICDHLQSAMAIVRQTFAPPSRRRIPDAPRSIMLRSFVQSVVTVFNGQARDKGLRIVQSCDLGLRACVSADLLSMVLVNIVGNAVKYTDSGHVTIRAADAGVGWAHISVADSGIGIDATTLAKLTQPGVRGQTADVLARQGDGLGLASAESAARSLGTTLIFESERGLGTVVSFTLPLVP